MVHITRFVRAQAGSGTESRPPRAHVTLGGATSFGCASFTFPLPFFFKCRSLPCPLPFPLPCLAFPPPSQCIPLLISLCCRCPSLATSGEPPLSLPFHCLSSTLSLPYHCLSSTLSLPCHCLSLTSPLASHCHSLTVHCLSLPSHCLSLTLRCISTASPPLTPPCLSSTSRRSSGKRHGGRPSSGCLAVSATLASHRLSPPFTAFHRLSPPFIEAPLQPQTTCTNAGRSNRTRQWT